MFYSDPCEIGELDAPCALCQQVDTPDDFTSILETYQELTPTIWAKITPVAGMTFFDQQQTEDTFTHRAFIRWIDYDDLNRFVVFIRKMYLPNGEQRNELYKVLRITPWQNGMWWIMIELCMLKYNHDIQVLPFSPPALNI